MEEEAIKYDWPAIRDRLAFLLYQFAIKGIGQDVKIDPLAADTAIRYCLGRAAGALYSSARHNHFLDFLCRHAGCGCLKWVMDGGVTSLLIEGASANRDYKWPPHRGELYLHEEEIVA